MELSNTEDNGKIGKGETKNGEDHIHVTMTLSEDHEDVNQGWCTHAED
jgi:hypothetical protein